MRTLFWFILAGIVLFPENGAASNVGKRYPSEKHVIVDRVTGRLITVLTSSRFNDAKPTYSTRHSWTADGNWIVFLSNRAGNKAQLFAVNELTGDIVQLTDCKGGTTGRFSLSSKEMKVYYMSERQVIELNIGDLVADSMNDQVKEPSVYERKVASLPQDYSQLTLDADDTYLYWGGHKKPAVSLIQPEGSGISDSKAYSTLRKETRAYLEAKNGKVPSEIYKINVKTGKIEKILDIPFAVGHLQANPWTPEEIFFNREPGGDPEQRIWSVKADGTNFRPIYVQTPDEWVTHTTVTGPDEIMFIISGHVKFLREKPSGVAVVNLRNNQMSLLGQIPAEDTGDEAFTGGVWHSHGSPDGRWAVADTFLGNIILIDRTTGEQTLLTTGHPMIPDQTHPTFSRDGKRILIQSGLLTNGKNLNLMILNVP